MIQRTRGSQVTLRTDTSLSSCSTLRTEEAIPSFSWSLVAANESRTGEQVAVDVGRDPRVLVIPPYTLGFAGSSYTFQFRSALGGENATTTNATGERLPTSRGGLVYPPTGGFRRRTSSTP